MIDFEAKNVDLPDFDVTEVSRWIREVAASHDRTVGNINYLFCDDREILEVNKKFLDHDYFTDIITFDYSHGNRISGDIFISLDTVASNAEELGEGFGRELMRVIIHGVLHLCGIDDKGPGERAVMERAENEALEMLV